MRKLNYLLIPIFVFAILGCEKKDAMVLDRVESPVLVLVEHFQTVEKVNITATFLELDKSGILDQTVGIDSIPISGMEIKATSNLAGTLGAISTNSAGKILIEKTWEQCGIQNPLPGESFDLWLSGNYNDQDFTKITRIKID